MTLLTTNNDGTIGTMTGREIILFVFKHKHIKYKIALNSINVYF